MPRKPATTDNSCYDTVSETATTLPVVPVPAGNASETATKSLTTPTNSTKPASKRRQRPIPAPPLAEIDDYIRQRFRPTDILAIMKRDHGYSWRPLVQERRELYESNRAEFDRMSPALLTALLTGLHTSTIPSTEPAGRLLALFPGLLRDCLRDSNPLKTAKLSTKPTFKPLLP